MSSLYEETLADIEEKKNRKENNKFNGIPFPFERYRDYFDTFEKGGYIGILASSGIGKSRFSRHIIYKAVDFALKNNYPTKILLFALEDDRKQINKKIICHYLFERHGISVSQRYLNSIDTPLPDKYIEIIKKDKEFWDLFESIVWIINDCTTPNEIHKRCEGVYAKYGKTHHLIAIVDNYANLVADTTDTNEWSAIRRFSRNIVRLRLCKTLGFTVIALCQSDIETEKNTFRNAGTKGLINIEPNSASLGDVKIIIRDFFVLLGLFSPFKYEIKEYPFAGAYNVDLLRNKFLSLLMLKNNNGELAPRLGMLFDGKHEVFEEMPLLTDKDTLERLYNKIKDEELLKREKFGQQRNLF